MHGFKYAFGGLLLAKGHREDAMKVVRGVRDRYDGRKRNPYNEIECGNNYARSMASFALLMIDNGFIFDLPNRMIGFDPQKDAVCGKAFASIWSLDGAWGTMEVNGNETVITVKEGALRANKLKLPYIDMVETVLVNGTPVDFTFENGITRLTEDLSTVNAVEIHVIRALV